MIWIFIGIIISYITAFITCEYSSKMGTRHPHKEGYYYGMFTTCLTTYVKKKYLKEKRKYLN